MRATLVLLPLLAAALSGCGRGGPPVAGTATADGAPIAAGTVRFTPDVDKGFKGPSVTLTLKDGNFSSAKDGEPVPAGEYVVAVMFVPAESNGEMPTEEHTFPATVPEGGKADFRFEVVRKKPGRKP